MTKYLSKCWLCFFQFFLFSTVFLWAPHDVSNGGLTGRLWAQTNETAPNPTTTVNLSSTASWSAQEAFDLGVQAFQSKQFGKARALFAYSAARAQIPKVAEENLKKVESILEGRGFDLHRLGVLERWYRAPFFGLGVGVVLLVLSMALLLRTIKRYRLELKTGSEPTPQTRRHFFVSGLFLVIALVVGWLLFRHPPQSMGYVWNTSTALRTGPRDDYSQIGQLQAGELLFIEKITETKTSDSSERWVYVNLTQFSVVKSGWVLDKDILKIDGPSR